MSKEFSLTDKEYTNLSNMRDKVQKNMSQREIDNAHMLIESIWNNEALSREAIYFVALNLLLMY